MNKLGLEYRAGQAINYDLTDKSLRGYLEGTPSDWRPANSTELLINVLNVKNSTKLGDELRSYPNYQYFRKNVEPKLHDLDAAMNQTVSPSVQHSAKSKSKVRQVRLHAAVE